MMSNEYSGLEIAIIGMSCRLPQACDTTDVFFEDLLNSKIITRNEKDLLVGGKVPIGTNLETKEHFDSEFWNYSKAEADVMHPQMRVLHEVIWQALEDGGYKPRMQKENIGLFVTSTSDKLWELVPKISSNNNQAGIFDELTFTNTDFSASRIAYNLNLTGPVVAIQTACSSSLVAVHQACQSILSGECDMALAGGVSASSFTLDSYEYEEGMIFSKDGYCSPFDIDSNGTTPGEGTGVVLLKSLESAIEDNDHIYAVIKGSATNNDGNRKVGFSAPSVHGQTEVIKKALIAADIHPNTIRYIESHGTATPLGDSIELKALKEVFKDTKLTLGMLKSNIGHTDVAAGILSLIKATLITHKKIIPPAPLFKQINPNVQSYFDFFRVNKEKETILDTINEPFRIGINSFGIGGTNAHVIIESYFPEKRIIEEIPNQEYWVPISAGNNGQLSVLKKNIRKKIVENPDIKLVDLQYTLQNSRIHHTYRELFCVKNVQDLVKCMDGDIASNVIYENGKKRSTNNSLIFLFAGQGSQQIGMGQELYYSYEAFKSSVDACAAIYQKINPNEDLIKMLFEGNNTAGENIITNTFYAQILLFTFEYSIVQLLASFGVKPSKMFGHSLGELICACVSGVFTLEEAIKIVDKRGELMQKTPDGKMLSVFCGYDDVEIPKDLTLSAINSTKQFVLSGKEKDIDEFIFELDKKEIFHKKILGNKAFHSHFMDDVLDEFKDFLSQFNFQKPTIPFISNITGDWITDEQSISIEYWVNQIREAVRFSKGIETITENKNNTFVEIGKGNIISGLLIDNGIDDESRFVYLDQKKQSYGEIESFKKSLARLWCFDNIDIQLLNTKTQEGRNIPLPTYPFYPRKHSILNLNALKSFFNNSSSQKVSVFTTHEEVSETEPEINSINEEDRVKLLVKKNFSKFLSLSQVSEFDDFFKFGGDSLKYMRLVSEIEYSLGVRIPVNKMFENNTIHKITQLVLSLKRVEDNFKLLPAIKKEYYNCSSAQKRMYIVQTLNKNDLSYNIIEAYEISGYIELKQIQTVLNDIVERHEVLRTTFHQINNDIFQKIHEDVTVEVEYYDVTSKNVNQLIHEFNVPFLLSSFPLLKCGLVKVDENKHVLVFNIHHIIMDGTSMENIIVDFKKRLEGVEIPELEIQYKDYSEWQSQFVKSNFYLSQGEFWKTKLEGCKKLKLPYDKLVLDYDLQDSSSLTIVLDREIREGFLKFIELNKTTLYISFLGIYSILLHKISGQKDILIGSPDSGRNHPLLYPLVGMFVNFLPVRNNIEEEESFTDFIQRLSSSTMEMFANKDYQYDQIINEIGGDGDMSDIINAVLVVQNYVSSDTEYKDNIDSLEIQRYNYEKKSSPFDLILGIYPSTESLAIQFDFNPSKFRIKTIKMLQTYLISLMNQAIKNPEIKISDMNFNDQNVEIEEVMKKNKSVQINFKL